MWIPMKLSALNRLVLDRVSSLTMGNVFTLHCIIAYNLHHRKRLFAAFLDYKRAFDLVDRNFLWLKLLNQGISGRVL